MGLPQFQCTCDNFGVTPSYTNDTFDVTKEAVSVGLKNPNLMAMAIVPSVIKNYHDLLYTVHVTSIKKTYFIYHLILLVVFLVIGQFTGSLIFFF